MSFIKKNDLINNVKIKNYVNNPYPILLQSDIFILSSKYEGLPNALLEAVTLKKICISSDCPTGPKEILLNGKGGLLFKVGNYKDLASKIHFSFKNRKILNQKKLYAYKKLTRYDFNKNLLEYFRLIKPFLMT